MSVADVIERNQALPFEWAKSDCCQFVGECISAVTGDNAADLYDYGSQREAQEMIEDAGDLVALVSLALGDPVERAPAEHDVVLVTCNGMQILGFVWQARVLLRTQQGLVDWPLDKVEVVWCLK